MNINNVVQVFPSKSIPPKITDSLSNIITHWWASGLPNQGTLCALRLRKAPSAQRPRLPLVTKGGYGAAESRHSPRRPQGKHPEQKAKEASPAQPSLGPSQLGPAMGLEKKPCALLGRSVVYSRLSSKGVWCLNPLLNSSLPATALLTMRVAATFMGEQGRAMFLHAFLCVSGWASIKHLNCTIFPQMRTTSSQHFHKLYLMLKENG